MIPLIQPCLSNPPRCAWLCCVASAPSVPVVAQFDPNNLLVVGLLPRPAVTAGPRPLRHLHLQTLGVEGSRARVAAQQLASYMCKDVMCAFVWIVGGELICRERRSERLGDALFNLDKL